MALEKVMEVIKTKKIGLAILSLFTLLIVTQFVLQISLKEPFTEPVEVRIMQELDARLPYESQVMVLSSYYAPWVYGFTHHRVIAPGMFEWNRWSREEWDEFWNAEDFERQHELLDRYDKPLYIYVGMKDEVFRKRFEQDSRLVKLNEYIWQYP